MAKQSASTITKTPKSTTTKSTTSLAQSYRPKKKARIESPAPASNRSTTKFAARIKSSPRPVALKNVWNEEEDDDRTTTTQKSGKGKGKQKQDGEGEGDVVDLPKTFKVVAGSYEKLLYGLEGSTSVEQGEEGEKVRFELKPIFIFPAHVSCIKAVAASPTGGKWLATGSADEIVKVWDLRRRKEIGGLMHHEGSITHLLFPSRSHLLSASEDGTLCIFHARDWSVLRALKGHKGRVNSVDVHPSGKVALSVGKDRTLRMWDLMRGKGCASMKLGKEGEIVRWSVSGKMFAVQSGSTIDVYTTDMVLLHTINHPARLHDVKFCKRVNADANENTDDAEEELLLAGAEDKKVSIYTISNNQEKVPEVVGEMVGHSNRVKAIQTLSVALPTPMRPSTTIVSTVSSDGKIHVYDLVSVPVSATSEKEVAKISPVAEYDTKGTRLTCVTLADGEAVGVSAGMNGKRKRSEGNVEEDDEEGEDGGSEDGDGEENEGEWGGIGDEEENEEEEEEEEEEEVEGESE